MRVVLTAAEMRQAEKAAIAAGRVTGLELMQRAGAAVFQALLEEWPRLVAPSRARVLCGPGNNGGDGFVIAGLLRQRGWQVELYLFGDPAALPPDARRCRDLWCEIGEVLPWPDQDGPAEWKGALIVDALFGTGLRRPIARELGLSRFMPDRSLQPGQTRPRVLAVDVPSGLCADSGRVLADSDCGWADLTVTFQTLKPGHLLAEGPDRCGNLVVADLGVAVPEPAMLSELAPPQIDLAKHRGHKFNHGHLLVLAGGVGRGGAARLAARAGLRIGAGLVTIGVAPEALAENAARLDAIMLREVDDARGLTDLLADPRLTALCLGPGLGLGEREAGVMSAALAPTEGARRATVLDADALSLLARHPNLMPLVHDRCVLTPHEGEFARLFPDLAARLNDPAAEGPAYSKLDAARDAAARVGCVVLIKGVDTVIAAPSGQAEIHAAIGPRAAPWLATAGSGDVLAGFVAGLMARGIEPFTAARAAVWLHVDCARSFGPGLIAEDLPEELPKVLRLMNA